MVERTGTVYNPLSLFLLSEAYVRNENIDWVKFCLAEDQATSYLKTAF